MVVETPAEAPAVEVPSAGAITDADSALSVLEQTGTLLQRAGDALRAADASNPLAFRISRTGLWLLVQGDPPAENGQTYLPSPPDHVRGAFDGMAEAGNWDGILATVDEIAGEYALWLDPHRHAANALEQLGHADAKMALLREVALLLARAPQIPELSFNDGTPLCDEQTKGWIESEVRPVLGAGGGASAGGGGGAAAPGGKGFRALEKAMTEARGLIENGDPLGAIQTVSKVAATAVTPVDRFRSKLGIAQICIQLGQFPIARPQLEVLERMAKQHRLEEWDPELCADLYGALYTTLRALNQGFEVPEEARKREMEVFERLCELDAAAAFRLSTEGAQ